jgi:hypothetical protein
MSTGEYLNGNTAIGTNALIGARNTSARDNSAFGINSLSSLVAGSNENTGIGSETLRMNLTGENTAVGAYASNKVTGTHNTSVGNWALRYNATGNSNTAMGHRALAGTLTESDPVTVPSGNQNTGVGSGALRGNNNGNDNTAIGYQALYNNIDAINNTAIGSMSLHANTTGIRNTAIGFNALMSNTTAIRNTGIGSRSLVATTTGGENTAIGRNTMINNTTGSGNTVIGHQVGNTITSETNNTLIGSHADIGSGITHGTAIGALAKVTQSNSIVLGRTTTDRVGIRTTAPDAALHVNAGIALSAIRSTSANASMGVDDMIMIVTSGSPTITLPAPGSFSANGHMFIIKNNGPGTVSVKSSANLSTDFANDSSATTTNTISVNTGISYTFANLGSRYYIIQH